MPGTLLGSRYIDEALYLPFRRERSNGKEGDRQTNIIVKWSEHGDSCDGSFGLTDATSVLSWSLLIQMERQES